MNFERHKDPKEAFNIGLKSKAVVVEDIIVALDTGKSMMVYEYNDFDQNSRVYVIHDENSDKKSEFKNYDEAKQAMGPMAERISDPGRIIKILKCLESGSLKIEKYQFHKDTGDILDVFEEKFTDHKGKYVKFQGEYYFIK